MSQRGGSVVTQVRYGEKVFSPIIGQGSADILVSFESMEALRYLSALRKDGSVVVNNYEIPTATTLSGEEQYPADSIERLQKLAKTYVLDAAKIAAELGNPKSMINCAVNPQCARERYFAYNPILRPRTVVIVGGGIAGCEAARVLAIRGHQPILYEKTSRLGGAFNEAGVPSFKEDDRALIQWYEHTLRQLNVEMHFNTELSSQDLQKMTYDVLMIATGATAKAFSLGDKRSVITAKEALASKGSNVGERAVIIGGGMGGDVTGGYVIMVPNLSWYNKSFVRGLQEEWFSRMEKIPGAVRAPALDEIGCTDPALLHPWRAIHDCVSRGGYGGCKASCLVRAVYFEPNQLKIELDKMLLEHRDAIRVMCHSWGTKPIMV